jgi:hypothetical protein
MISLSAPPEPMVRDINFARLAAGDCTDAAFRARCVPIYKSVPMSHPRARRADGPSVLQRIGAMWQELTFGRRATVSDEGYFGREWRG